MKKLIITLLAMTPSLALSMGGVVTDPMSYTYYIKQLEQGITQLEKVEAQIKTATDTYEKATSIDKNLSGNLQRAQRSLQKIKDIQNLSSKDLKASLQYAKDALKEIQDIPEYREEITEGVEDVFGIDATKDAGWVSVEAEKKAQRQQAYKTALIDSELALGKIELQYEGMEELATATNSATSLKDSTDVTNTILLEMLDNQREMITLLANVTKNISMAFYDGDTAELEKPELTQPTKTSGTKRTTASCGPYDKHCKKQSIDEMMAELKQAVEAGEL